MPHLRIEYSDNLAGLAVEPMLAALNAAVVASGQLHAEHDLKTRATAVGQFAVGTQVGEPRGFVHAELRLLAGRTPEAKRDLSDRIAAVLREHTPQPQGMLVQLSVDIADMDRDAYYKGQL